MLSVHLLNCLVELFLQSALVLFVLVSYLLNIIAQRIQLFARGCHLRVVYLDAAHIARTSLEQQVANKSVHLTLGAIFDVRMQRAHTLRAVVVVTRHFHVCEAVDEKARHLVDPILASEDLLVLALKPIPFVPTRMNPFVEHQHGVIEKVGEDFPEERDCALNVRREPWIHAVETQNEQVDGVELSDVVDYVGNVLHVLAVAVRVRLALGVEKTQLAILV